MRDAAPTTKAQRDSKKKPKRRKGSKAAKRQVVCQICHKQFKRITAEHLREHGYTLTRYRRMYLAPTRGTGGSSGPTDDPSRQTVATIAERIVHNPDVIRELAGEVSEAIFGSSLRDALRLSLVSVVAERLKAHGEATAALRQVRAELSQEWRTTQGGPNGSPTPTKDLLGMASVLGQEVKTGEELLLKAVKLAIDERKGDQGRNQIDGGLPDRFTGSAEILPVPANLTSGDREAIRQLWSMFDKGVEAKRTITVQQSGMVSASDTPEPPGEILTPGMVSASDTGGSPEPTDDPQPEGTERSAPTPLVGDDEPF